MNPSDALAQHRLARAHAALQEADILIERGHFNGEQVRIFVGACEEIVRALRG